MKIVFLRKLVNKKKKRKRRCEPAGRNSNSGAEIAVALMVFTPARSQESIPKDSQIEVNRSHIALKWKKSRNYPYFSSLSVFFVLDQEIMPERTFRSAKALGTSHSSGVTMRYDCILRLDMIWQCHHFQMTMSGADMFGSL